MILEEHEKLSSKTIQKHYREDGADAHLASFNQGKMERNRKVFFTATFYVGVIDLEETKKELKLDSIDGKRKFVYGLYDTMKLVGTLDGLMELKEDGAFVPNNLGIPELSSRVVFIQNIGNQDVLFGTRGEGLVYLNADTS